MLDNFSIGDFKISSNVTLGSKVIWKWIKIFISNRKFQFGSQEKFFSLLVDTKNSQFSGEHENQQKTYPNQTCSDQTCHNNNVLIYFYIFLKKSSQGTSRSPNCWTLRMSNPYDHWTGFTLKVGRKYPTLLSMSNKVASDF